MAVQQDFSEFSGNDFVLRIAVIDEATNEPLPLNGALALIWALAKRAKGQPIITKSLGNGLVVTDASGGLVEVSLTAAETEPLKGVYYHEMRMTNAIGAKSTLMYGTAELLVNLIRN